MLDTSLELGRTRNVIGTEDGRLSLHTHERCATLGTASDEAHLLAHHEGAGIEVHGRYLGDDLPTLLHEHHIADMQVEVGHEVCIMQCCTFDHGTRELHGLEVGHGGHRTGASHLVGHLIKACDSLLGLKLIGDSPARHLGCIAKHALLYQRIDLDDDAIRCHGEVLALGVPVVDILEHLVQRSALAHGRRHLEAPLGGMLQALVVSAIGQLLP